MRLCEEIFVAVYCLSMLAKRDSLPILHDFKKYKVNVKRKKQGKIHINININEQWVNHPFKVIEDKSVEWTLCEWKTPAVRLYLHFLV